MRNQEEGLAACPVSFVTKDAPPFLIIHGEEDHTVPFSQGVLIYEELEKVGCDVTLLAIEERIMRISGSSRERSGRRSRNFLKRNYKGFRHSKKYTGTENWKIYTVERNYVMSEKAE